MWNDEQTQRGTVLIDDVAHPAMIAGSGPGMVLYHGKWQNCLHLQRNGISMSGFRTGYRHD